MTVADAAAGRLWPLRRLDVSGGDSLGEDIGVNEEELPLLPELFSGLLLPLFDIAAHLTAGEHRDAVGRPCFIAVCLLVGIVEQLKRITCDPQAQGQSL